MIETIHGWMHEGSESSTGLVQGSDGCFYGTTSSGGIRDNGTIFRISATGEYTVLHYFAGRDIDSPDKVSDGSFPGAKMIQGRDGWLYGATRGGGANGHGTIFRINPSGEYSVVHSFSVAEGSSASGLVQGSDGYIYGATPTGGPRGFGTFFRVSTAGEFTVLRSFTDGYAGAGVVQGSDGYFYGTTSFSMANPDGTVFRVSAAGEFKILHSFTGTDGRYPNSALVVGQDGYLYGTTETGGTNGRGVVFRISATGEYRVLHSFSNVDGSLPESGLELGSDGYLYGTTASGGVGNRGTIYRISTAGEHTVLHSFSDIDGSSPRAGVVQGSDGYLYGNTLYGGIDQNGVIFRVSTTGSEYAILHSFSPRTDIYSITKSVSGVVQGNDRSFYGTTYYSGAHGYGSIFRISLAGEHTVLHSFNDIDGSVPQAGVVQGSDGYFYGTTSYGGANSKGTVFRVSGAGEYEVLHSFNGKDGSFPVAKLVQGIDGYFYGTTADGGIDNNGVVFRVSSLGEYTLLHLFNNVDGSDPRAELVQGSDGFFYGTTSAGGANRSGAIFRVSTAGMYEVIHSFSSNGSNGSSSYAGLVQGGDGFFYGTTYFGGANGKGTVFRVSTTGEYEMLHSFGGVDGANPAAGLVRGSDGFFYGTTYSGGESDSGIIFRINAARDYAVLHAFGKTDGQNPVTAPIVGRDGNLWGTASRDTVYAAGIIYRFLLDPVTLPADRVTYSSGNLRARVGHLRGTVVQFEWSDDATLAQPAYTDWAPLPEDTDAAVVSAALSQLKPGTIYYYRVHVRRADSAIQLGEILSFTTGLAEPQTTVLATKGAAVPGAGTPGSGIPSGATWTSFGVPALGGNSQLAFGAGLKLSTGELLTGIFAGDPAAPMLMLKKGDAVNGLLQGSVFASFKDPLLNSAGELAFIGTVSGGGKNRQGIWSNAGFVGGKPDWVVALHGTEAIPLSSGTRWNAFTSVALSDSGVISFTATLEKGRGGVTAANDSGLWQAKPSGTSLLLREGQELVLDGVTRKVKSFIALSSEQGRPTADGKLPVKVTFRDNTQALLQLSADAEPEVIAASGDAVSEAGSVLFRSFGVPALNQAGTAAFAATLRRGTANVDGSNDSGIFITREDNWGVIARKGGEAPGVTWKGAPGKFVSFADPLINAEGQVAFMGTATGGAKGIWRSKDGSEEGLQLVASTTTAVPGVIAARFAAFKSVALLDGTLAGPVFVAKLEGKGITPANDVGLWAVDSEGVLRLIVREGDLVDGKVLRSCTFLNTVPGSSAQPRSYDAQRQLIYRAFFTDGAQALVTVLLP